MTSTVPLDQLSRVIQQPASTSLQDPRSILSIELPAICGVCYNFSARHAPQDPNTLRRPWAHQEYKLPEGTAISHITVDKTDDVLQRSNAGCVYCSMIMGALGAVHPGWHTEKTVIHIYLAENIPVIVRLRFGSTAKVPLTREAARDLGMDLPEGQTFSLTIDINDPLKPDIEVEIFRPIIPQPQLTVAGEYNGIAFPS